jgi:HAMP domain-containing protein
MLGAMRDGVIPRQPLPVRRDDEIGALAGAFNGLLQGSSKARRGPPSTVSTSACG